MGILFNTISKEELKPGDHIYSWRKCYFYAHHGIYAGDDKVIHFTRGAGQEVGTSSVFLDRIIFCSSFSFPMGVPCQKCGDQSKSISVTESCIDCFLAGGALRLFQYGVSRAHFLAQARGGTCTLAASDSPDCVLHRANYLLKDGFGIYNVFKNNCEDFAIYCKTGLVAESSSGQVVSVAACRTASVNFAIAGITRLANPVVGYVFEYCRYRLANDIGVRRDVTQISVEKFVEAIQVNNQSSFKPDQ